MHKFNGYAIRRASVEVRNKYRIIKRAAIPFLAAVDLVTGLLAIPSGFVLKTIRMIGIQHLPFSKRVLWGIGVFPVRNHYYEPQFDPRTLKIPLTTARLLPGVNWDAKFQIELLSRFNFNDELEDLPLQKSEGKLEFYLNNENFGPGDAESWYNIIRYFKPKRIIEIGCGYSTLMAQRAIAKNRLESNSYACQHICIEPYEMQWLEQIGTEVIRTKVEETDSTLFQTLCENDILFIDSSHVIRPQGDVLAELLEILPQLKPGVIVHIHDIFSPHDYPVEWVCERVRLWNEQYLLEAFLTFNSKYKIIYALNFLHHFYYDELKSKCCFLSRECEPASFYIQKTS